MHTMKVDTGHSGIHAIAICVLVIATGRIVAMPSKSFRLAPRD